MLSHLDSLDVLDQTLPQPSGKPLQLLIELIDEDPDQPRTEFDLAALQGLAETIKQHGVVQAITVRPHPQHMGRWMMNEGARRLRACKLAGLSTIPANVEEQTSDYRQVIENLQREALSPLEFARFVQRRLQAGDIQAQIATALGVSRQTITHATALIDPPHWLLNCYCDGRCTGQKELYDLRKLHARHPQAVESWLADRARVTRSDVEALSRELNGAQTVVPLRSAHGKPMAPKRPPVSGNDGPAERLATLPPAASVPVQRVEMQRAAACPEGASVHAISVIQALLWARYKDTDVVVDLTDVPPVVGQLYVRAAGQGKRIAVYGHQLQIVRVQWP